MTSHDQLAKDLFQNFFGDLLRLAAPREAARLDHERAVFVDKQAFTDWPAGERRELDLLAETPRRQVGRPPVLVHVEIEAQARAGMAERLWKYYMQLRLRHGRLVLPILVNLRGGRPGLCDAVLAEGFRPETARFRYLALSLAGCRAEEYLSREEPLAWALAALMRPGSWRRAEQKIECMRRIAAAELSEARRWLLGNWVQTYLQLKGRDAAEYERLRDLTVNREVKTMEMTWAEQMEARYKREGIQQGIQEGIQEGIKEGIKEGIQQGVGALRRVVLRLLGQRIGAVPEVVRRNVEAIEKTDQLEELADQILAGRTLEEMGLR